MQNNNNKTRNTIAIKDLGEIGMSVSMVWSRFLCLLRPHCLSDERFYVLVSIVAANRFGLRIDCGQPLTYSRVSVARHGMTHIPLALDA